MTSARKGASRANHTRQPAFAILRVASHAVDRAQPRRAESRAGAGEIMDDTQTAPRAHRAGGREAKRAARLARAATSVPYITRKIGIYEVLDEEGLALI